MGMERQPDACWVVPIRDRKAMPSTDHDNFVDTDRFDDPARDAVGQDSHLDYWQLHHVDADSRGTWNGSR